MADKTEEITADSFSASSGTISSTFKSAERTWTEPLKTTSLGEDSQHITKSFKELAADGASLWDEVKNFLQEKLDRQIFLAWIKPLELKSLKSADEEIFVELYAPNKFCRDHVEKLP